MLGRNAPKPKLKLKVEDDVGDVSDRITAGVREKETAQRVIRHAPDVVEYKPLDGVVLTVNPTVDDELMTLTLCSTLLDQLELNSQDRILGYLSDRFGRT